MAYHVINTIKGRRYLYEQRTWREGKRVRTECRYIGPLDGGRRRMRLARQIAGFLKANLASPKHGVVDEERWLREQNERAARDLAARQAALGVLHSQFGLRTAETPPANTQATQPAMVPDEAAKAEATAGPAAAGESSADASEPDADST